MLFSLELENPHALIRRYIFSNGIMPSRLQLCTHCLRRIPQRNPYSLTVLKYASTTAHAPALATSLPPDLSYPITQPPSYKPPEYRKSQLHRQYTSLLRSSPLLLFFQHNNLKATEWVAVRRELAHAMRAADDYLSNKKPIADTIKINIVQTRIFESALLVVDHFHPELLPPAPPAAEKGAVFTHALSRTAYEAVSGKKLSHPLHPLLCGPVAVLSFPEVSPQHLKAALSILSPKGPQFPAPTRRANPGYYDLVVQAGLQKLLLLGARVEGNVFDVDGTRWVGGIEGGMEGLRAHLVGLLGSVGAGVTGVLESAGRNLYYTLEGRRAMLEEDGEKGSKVPEEGTKGHEQPGNGG